MTSNDYNRTHDPLLRGWTRKQSKRRATNVALLIVGAIFWVILIMLWLIVAMSEGPRTAHGQVVCAAQSELTICPPSIEAIEPRAWLPGVWQ